MNDHRFYDWQIASGAPSGRWHICKWIEGVGRGMVNLDDKSGRRRFFRTHDAAIRALVKLECVNR